jgi:uncharacterized membrane protein YkvA (DUF1232 family)
MIIALKQRARQLKQLLSALYVACRDPRTPRIARIVAICVIAYAVSPLDLIPDPVPVLGYLDDLILLPLGIALAIRLIPAEVWADAKTAPPMRIPVNRAGAVVIVLIWILLAILGVILLRRWW